jgi:hypothetical protein
MEDDLKILLSEYLSNHRRDLPQILELRLGDRTKNINAWNEDDLYLKWRRHPMEDDLKILKVGYLRNHLLDHTQILNLSSYDQTIFCKYLK